MKLSFLKIFIVLALTILLQSSVVGHIFPNGLIPDLMLLVVLLASLRLEGATSLILAFSAGLFQDFTSGKYIGPHASGCVVAVYFLIIISRHIYADRFTSLMLVCFLCTLIKQAVAYSVVLAFLGLRSLSFSGAALQIFYIALVSALVAPLVSSLLFRSKIKR